MADIEDWNSKPEKDRLQILKKAGYKKLKKEKGGGYVNPGMKDAYKDEDFEPDEVVAPAPKTSPKK